MKRSKIICVLLCAVSINKFVKIRSEVKSMKKSKISILLILLTIALLSMFGCVQNKGGEAPKGNDEIAQKTSESFLTDIYEVKDYEMYEKCLATLDKNPAEPEKAYEEYRQKYNKNINASVLDNLFENGYAYYMDSVAYEHGFTFNVKSIDLKVTNDKENVVAYRYTVNLECVSDSNTTDVTESGTIQLEITDKEEPEINFFKMDHTEDYKSIANSL